MLCTYSIWFMFLLSTKSAGGRWEKENKTLIYAFLFHPFPSYVMFLFISSVCLIDKINFPRIISIQTAYLFIDLNIYSQRVCCFTEKTFSFQKKALSKEIQNFSILPSQFEMHFWTLQISNYSSDLQTKQSSVKQCSSLRNILTQ